MFNTGKKENRTDNWTTPKQVFDALNDEYHFDVFDPCPLNADFDGLKLEWPNKVFVNPPYKFLKTSKLYGTGWIEKCHNEAQKGKTVVCLIPSRTDTSWYHDIILAHNYEVRFLRGRLKFGEGKKDAPFASIVVIMSNTSDVKK
jgi:hypothetical protein